MGFLQISLASFLQWFRKKKGAALATRRVHEVCCWASLAMLSSGAAHAQSWGSAQLSASSICYKYRQPQQSCWDLCQAGAWPRGQAKTLVQRSLFDFYFQILQFQQLCNHVRVTSLSSPPSSPAGLVHFYLTFTVVSDGTKAEVLGFGWVEFGWVAFGLAWFGWVWVGCVWFGLVWFGGFSWCLFRICCWFFSGFFVPDFLYLLSVYSSGNIRSFHLTTEVWTDSSLFLGWLCLNQITNQYLAVQDYEKLAAAFFKIDLSEQPAILSMCLPSSWMVCCKLGGHPWHQLHHLLPSGQYKTLH